MVQTINNISNTASNILSIQVSLNGFSFCISDQDRQIIAVEQDNFGVTLTPNQMLDKIKFAFDNNPLLKKDFKTIEVIHQNDIYTLVPKVIFDANYTKDYLKYNCKILENDFIAYDEVDQHDIVVVYVPYANINNFFFDTFGSFTYKHSCSILTASILLQKKNSDHPTVFANINSKSFDLLVVLKGKLILVNTFSKETKEDFLYYVMFTAEQLALNPEEFELIFLGNIQEENEYYNIALNYIRNISLGGNSHRKEIDSSMNMIEPHQHFVLLSQF